MLSFTCDYNTGAHAKILARLKETNDVPQTGYGFDDYTAIAREKIRQAIGMPDAEVTFLAGGTQTNQVVIDALLKSYEGVIAADTGHVNCHEAGAIEFTGHKVLALPGKQGKIGATELRSYLEAFYADANHEHMVFPGMIYLTHPTELGTLYSRRELTAIRDVADSYHLPVYMDGARLAYGLAADECDLTLEDIASLTDVFYIGGTKCGALIGEAVVFTRHNEPEHFLTVVKQHGALLAKGRLIGIQFETLFTDDLYLENGRNGVRAAMQIKEALKEKGYRLYIDSPTNQQFVVMENRRLEKLKKKVQYDFWENLDEDHTVIRLCSSWATCLEDVEALIALL